MPPPQETRLFPVRQEKSSAAYAVEAVLKDSLTRTWTQLGRQPKLALLRCSKVSPLAPKTVTSCRF